MDPVQSMPTMESLTQKEYSVREWLHYYKNIWTRNITAREIDIQVDIVAVEVNPEKPVICEDGEVRAVKDRLELRKKAIEDGINILKAVDSLLLKQDGEIENKWNDIFITANTVLKAAPVEEEKASEPAVDEPAVDESAEKASESVEGEEAK